MKRIFFFTVVCVMMLATVASAQMMGSGHKWPHSSDPNGIIPHAGTPPTVDGVLEEDEKANALHFWWGPSIITEWGDTYGYNRGPDYTPDRVAVGAAGDLDNSLALGDDEDASEKATDADWFGHFYWAWAVMAGIIIAKGHFGVVDRNILSEDSYDDDLSLPTSVSIHRNSVNDAIFPTITPFLASYNLKSPLMQKLCRPLLGPGTKTSSTSPPTSQTTCMMSSVTRGWAIGHSGPGMGSSSRLILRTMGAPILPQMTCPYTCTPLTV